MKICMIGTGYVGLVSGTCFADLGNKVICVDNDKNKINKLKKGISPIYEPGLDDLIRNNYRSKRLDFTDDLEKAVKDSQIIFICVGTPTKKGSNLVDLSQVYDVAKSISKNIKSYKIIVNKSTVPISLIYIRTGSVVLPKSESTVVNACSASSAASSSVTGAGASDINKASASGASS